MTAVSDLFRGMLRGTETMALDALAHIVMVCYLLANRLGHGFARLDQKLESRLHAHLQAGHELEQWFGDFSGLLRHLRGARKEPQHHGTSPAGGESRSI